MFTIGAPLWGGASASAVKILLPLNGANGSTVFTDLVSANIWSVGGGTPSISTADSKFGGSSLMCPNGSYIKLNSPSVEFLPTADYSVEFWAKVPFDSQFAITSPVDTFILELIVESTVVRHRRSGMLMQPNIGDGSGSVVGRWVHAFAGRKSGIDYVACNGVMTSNSSNPYTLTSLADLYIGMFNYPGSPAYIQDLRYIVGDCAYTASFTPPAAPYTL